MIHNCDTSDHEHTYTMRMGMKRVRKVTEQKHETSPGTQHVLTGNVRRRTLDLSMTGLDRYGRLLKEKARALHAATAPKVATVAVRTTAETTRIARLRFGAGATTSPGASIRRELVSSTSIVSLFLLSEPMTCASM